jgi:16S rRNA C967 or C1407 C5-methylase (RsmB/RsmF family)
MAKLESKGPAAFERYYADLFGERWPSLKDSLTQKKTEYIAIPQDGVETQDMKKVDWAPFAYYAKEEKDTSGDFYFLDLASLVPVLALELKGNEKVLDLCAAPGGKSLAIMNKLTTGHLTANDRSDDRRLRLLKVLRDFVRGDRHDKFKVTGHDATKWCLYEKDAYDAILLDAPCSSERHVVNDPKHLADWSFSRMRYLAKEQWAMLAGALDVVKVGGRIVYSTCALTDIENDQIIQKLVAKRKERIRLIDFKSPIGEKTEFGYHILPDKDGHGPIYFSVIQRIS